MIEYKVETYEDLSSFRDGLNNMANKGYLLHSFKKTDHLFYKFIVVFYKEKK